MEYVWGKKVDFDYLLAIRNFEEKGWIKDANQQKLDFIEKYAALISKMKGEMHMRLDKTPLGISEKYEIIANYKNNAKITLLNAIDHLEVSKIPDKVDKFGQRTWTAYMHFYHYLMNYNRDTMAAIIKNGKLEQIDIDECRDVSSDVNFVSDTEKNMDIINVRNIVNKTLDKLGNNYIDLYNNIFVKNESISKTIKELGLTKKTFLNMRDTMMNSIKINLEANKDKFCCLA